MIITHASMTKIEEVKVDITSVYRGCLFFGGEGNTYNLTSCNFQYNLEVDEDNVIEARRFFYEHSSDEAEVLEVLESMRGNEFCFMDMADEQLCELLDETEISMDAETSWLVQQYQGILAHKLGYDCVESVDEQGTVYIAYCIGRKLEEVAE